MDRLEDRSELILNAVSYQFGYLSRRFASVWCILLNSYTNKTIWMILERAQLLDKVVSEKRAKEK